MVLHLDLFPENKFYWAFPQDILHNEKWSIAILPNFFWSSWGEMILGSMKRKKTIKGYDKLS